MYRPVDLIELAELIRLRNDADKKVADFIGRPAHSGHLGEFVAAHVFDIRLHENATHKASDGHFVSGNLAGRSVNIKFYGRNFRLLDMIANSESAEHADYYLVMTGPSSVAASSKGTASPWVIDQVFLFESVQLLDTLKSLGRSPGVATSLRADIWHSAMIFPEALNPGISLSDSQRELLQLFATLTPQE